MSSQTNKTEGKQAAGRVLACVSCQQRKIRCDRRFPCAHCQKSNTKCVPATQTRQRRKRFPERELLDRLRRYEGLLKQNNVKFEPLHKEHERYEALGHGSDEDEDQDMGGQEPPPAYSTPGGASTTSSMKSDRVADVKNIWHAVAQESPHEPPENTPAATALGSAVKHAFDEMIEGDNFLFGVNRTRLDLSTFHPDPVTVFRLWQLYLVNVDPLLKITHAPTLQGRIVEAMADLQNMPTDLEAVLFGVYLLAVLSLSEQDCMAQLGRERDEMITKYQFGSQQALMNANYLRSNSRDCLTGFYMYLLSFPGTYNPRSLNSMLASAVRTAQCMGIHRESSLEKQTPFEAEMRRRLWWSLMIYDARMSEKADFKDVSLNPTWDCNIPLLCNDSDLWPGMKELPKGKTTLDDSIFAVVRSDLADHLRNSEWNLDFTNPKLKPLARELPRGGDLDLLQARIQATYLQNCDPSNPLQFFVVHMSKTYLLRFRLWAHYAEYLKNGSQTDQQRDAAFLYAIEALEVDTTIMASRQTAGYHWYMQSYFPFPAYMHIVQHLRKWPLAELAPRAWEAMHANSLTRTYPQRVTKMPLAIMFEKTVMAAWEARLEACQGEDPPPEPKVLATMRQRAAVRAEQHAAETSQSPSGQSMFSCDTLAFDPKTLDFGVNFAPLFNDQGDGMLNDFMGLNGGYGQQPATNNTDGGNWFMPS